jgi:hypothetical protein
LFVIEVTRDGRLKLAAINRAEEQVVGLSNEETAASPEPVRAPKVKL